MIHSMGLLEIFKGRFDHIHQLLVLEIFGLHACQHQQFVQLICLFNRVLLTEQAHDIDLVNEVAAHVPHMLILSKNYLCVHDLKACLTVFFTFKYNFHCLLLKNENIYVKLAFFFYFVGDI